MLNGEIMICYRCKNVRTCDWVRFACKEEFEISRCNNQFLGETIIIGIFDTPEKAFYAYKNYKEHLIKDVAILEYKNNNITKECYDAMMNYQVEITD